MTLADRLLTPQQKAWRELGDLLFPPAELNGHHPGFGMEPLTLRPAEVAEVIGLSKREIFRLIRQGEIPSFKVGKSRLVAVSDLKAWVAAHREDA